MNSQEIVNGWKKRCIDAGVSISEICANVGISPAIPTVWANNASKVTEVAFIKALEKHVPFSVIAAEAAKIEWPNKKRIFSTYILIEQELRRVESARETEAA